MSGDDFTSGSSDYWEPSQQSSVSEMSVENNEVREVSTRRRNSSRQRLGHYATITKDAKTLLLNLYEEGKSISEAAQLTSIKINTAKTLISRYRKNDGVLVERKRGGNRVKILTAAILEWIERFVERDPGITLKNIKKKLFEETNVSLSISSINNGLRELKITLKLASAELDRMNNPRTLELRQKYAREFTQWVPQQREKLIFIDECGFNLHLRRSQARSKIGSRARIVLPTVRGRNVTLIAAINNGGVVHQMVIANSTVNADRFKTFLQGLLEKIVPQLENSFLIMDNARIHKRQDIQDIVQNSGCYLKFLPPYSPMLNPIEKAFSKIKSYARSILSSNTDHNIVDVIDRSVEQLNQNDCSNYVMDMVLLIPQAANGQALH